MLKSLLLSGWFRVQPFLKYVVIMTLIAPLLATFGHSSSAKQFLVETDTPVQGESDLLSEEMATTEADVASAIAVVKIISSQTGDSDSTSGETDTLQLDITPLPLETNFASSIEGVFDAVPMKIAAVRKPQLIQADAIESLIREGDSASENISVDDSLAAVELAPESAESASVAKDKSRANLKLAQRLRTYKAASLPNDVLVSQAGGTDEKLTAAKSSSVSKPATQGVNIVKEAEPTQEPESEDPLGSPHPIPWKWIMATQKSVSSGGGSGSRYYRSVPVSSPDGRYIVYSRVQLEVEPQMHNSRVSSVLFIEDTKTKNLRVLKSTNTQVSDPLLSVANSSPEAAKKAEGTIEIFVPVSWSKNGDRFLARKFQGVMNTSDVTDHAVIWDRQENRTNSVTPEKAEDEHNKMAILLGWSQNQPDRVIFRAGELGDEDWPLVSVATNNGETVAMNDVDNPVTFGKKITEVWAQPQVAISY